MVVPPKLVIFDTLSRCTNGMDENISKEVSQLFNLMTTFTKNEDLAVLFVHHTGKDESRKGRGSNVLSANADASIQIKGTTNGCEVVADRIKDADNFAPINLETEVVVFGQEKGENSLVLIKSDASCLLAIHRWLS